MRGGPAPAQPWTGAVLVQRIAKRQSPVRFATSIRTVPRMLPSGGCLLRRGKRNDVLRCQEHSSFRGFCKPGRRGVLSESLSHVTSACMVSLCQPDYCHFARETHLDEVCFRTQRNYEKPYNQGGVHLF